MGFRIENVTISEPELESIIQFKLSFEITKDNKKIGTCQLSIGNLCNSVHFEDMQQNDLKYKPFNSRNTRGCKEMKKCDTCGKMFRGNGQLKRHQDAVHLRLKRFRCEECGKCFPRKDYLKKHKICNHTGKRPHVCAECGKSFLHKCYLTAHIDIKHRGLEPFKCQECGKSYSQRGDLRLHVQKKHGDVQPFNCKECGAEFRNSCELEKHRKSHEEHQDLLQVLQEQAAATAQIQEVTTPVKRTKSIPKYECAVCGEQFARKREYDKHCKSHIAQEEQIEYQEEAVVYEEDEEWISSSSNEELESDESDQEYSTIDNNWDKIFG